RSLRRRKCCRARWLHSFLFFHLFLQPALSLGASLLHFGLSFSSHLLGVGNQAPSVGGKLFYSLLEFSFRLLGVASLVSQGTAGGNREGARCGVFSFGQCFLSLI